MSVLNGKISWFGGPNDKTTGPKTASGAPTSTPGIAVYNQSTLGGYWMVKLPTGHAFVTKQTDIGPAPSTGRKIDFTYSILPYLGYSQQNFPTNAQAQAVWLGKNITDVANNYSAAVGQLGLVTDQIPQPGASGAPFFSQLKKTGIQSVNFDLLTPTGGGSGYQKSIDSAGSAASSATNTAASAGDALSSIAGWLTNATNWLRIGEVIAGIILVAMGLRSLTGSTTTPVSVARSAVKVVK